MFKIPNSFSMPLVNVTKDISYKEKYDLAKTKGSQWAMPIGRIKHEQPKRKLSLNSLIPGNFITKRKSKEEKMLESDSIHLMVDELSRSPSVSPLPSPLATWDLDETVDSGTQLVGSSMPGHSFIQMEDDIDKQRLLGGPPSYAKADPVIANMTTDFEKKEKYDRLLRRAKTEDLSEVSGIGCLYQCGIDKMGRPVIVFIGKWFKFNQINLDKALLYLIHLLDPLVQSDYVIIYFHTITSGENHPSLAWIRQVYDILQYKHKKNLKAFYIVHPTFWTKIMTWWFTTFMAPQIKHKVHSLPGVEYLYDIIEKDQLEIPAYIIEHDMTVNGIRYYKSPVS